MANFPITGLNLFSDPSSSNLDYKQSSDSRQYSTSSNYAPVNTFTDSRQLILVLNSAGATTNTKKQDSVAASSAPTAGGPQSNTPSISGSAGVQQAPTGFLGGALSGITGGLATPLIIGAVIIGGVLILTRR